MTERPARSYLLSLIVLLVAGLCTGPFAATSALAQTRGTVLAADEPVVGASVFIAGTTTSAETGNDGLFELPSSNLAWYDIAAWHPDHGFGVVRFDPATRSGDVTIVLETPGGSSAAGSGPGDDDLQYFRDIAFAWTGNSGDVEIANPDVLVIERGADGYSVSASASAPLRLVNPQLGYEIILHEFRLEGSPVAVTWQGYPLFMEIPADGRRAERRITRGRERAFHGSERHFLRALALGRLKEEDFEAHHVRGPGDESDLNPVAEMEETGLGMGEIDPIFREGTRPGTRALIFQGWVRVDYLGSGVENRFIRYVDRFYPPSDVKDIILRAAEPEVVRSADRLANQGMGNQGQRAQNPRSVGSTWITLPTGAVAVDPLGSVLPQEGGGQVQMVGYWTFLRLAELLPYDYVPED